ncbi:MAG: DUF3782 domain-containing protein [Thermoprotei archaeon]
MESIKAIKDNPELAKELVQALLPYILQTEEFKLMAEVRDKLATLIDSTNRLWEAVNKNSEEIRLLREDNQRIWQAIERNSEDIKALREEAAKIWQAIEKNSEEIRLLREDNQRIWQQISKNNDVLERLIGTVENLTWTVKRIDLTLGGFTGRAGVYMQRAMLELYKEALKLHGVDYSKVSRVVLVDDVGVVSKGRGYEVDIIEEDGVTYLFEIKNYADIGALEQIEIRRKILEAKGKNLKIYLVANEVEERVKNEAEAQGVTVIAGHIVETPRQED